MIRSLRRLSGSFTSRFPARCSALVVALLLAAGPLGPARADGAGDGSVSGTLTYHVDGAPVSGAQMALWTELAPGQWAIATEMNTRPDGTFALAAAPGTYKLCVSLNLNRTALPACWTAGGGVVPPLDEFGNVSDPSVGDDVTITSPGADRPGTDIALVGGRLSGTTYRATDHSLLPTSVVVWSRDPDGSWSVVSSTEDDDGRWTVRVEPGTYWYCVYGNDGELWEPRCWRDVPIPVDDPHYYPIGDDGVPVGPMPGSTSVTVAADGSAPSYAASLAFRGFELEVGDGGGKDPVKVRSGKRSRVAVKARAGKRKAVLAISVTARKHPVRGRVLVKRAGRTIEKAKLSRKGRATVRLERQPRGRHKYRVVYLGTTGVKWSQKVVRVRVR